MRPEARAFVFLYLSLLSVIAGPYAGFAQPEVTPTSWKDLQQKKSGVIVVYWYESKPFIFRTPMGMRGIEFEIMEGFRKYVRETYNYNLRIVWREGKSFADTYATIQKGGENGIFGASAFSITPERAKEVAFSDSYMTDISVLITSREIPIVQTTTEFNRIFSRLNAITIEKTTYEGDLLRLKQHADLPFTMTYIPSSENILRTIEKTENSFGFIDLLVYMKAFHEDPSINVKRQNLFPVKREGYAIMLPLNSDWKQPFSEYFKTNAFHANLKEVIAEYIDIELYDFIEGLAVESNDLVSLLTREKEIQYQDLLGKSAQIQKESMARNILIAMVTIVLLFLIIIIVLYRKRSKQQRQIEMQQKSIEKKNRQLEKRNRHLVTLDEEKNNLIKILAHDLRTPINHVQGLAQVFLLSNNALPDDQKMLIHKITDASARLNKMISNILDIDSVENNRVKMVMDKIVVGDLVQQVAKTFDKQAARKNIDLLITPGTNGTCILGDSLFLTQVFENLISNALKFSQPGKEVQISTTEDEEHVQVIVKDSGPGLTEEDRKLLFRKFQRLSAKPTDGENSTGLGLSIVKKYVELMGGTVWCESEAGKGARFIVSFKKDNA